jgi:ketosteroid isomerase-like protein
MKAAISMTYIVAATLAITGCQAAPPQFTAQDEATLRGMFDSTVANMRSGNIDKWSQQFTETAVLQPPNAKSVIGRPAILAWGRALPVEELSFSNVQVAGDGNMGYGSSAYVLKPKGLSADTGKQLVVFRRSAKGVWEIPAVSFSSDLAPPMAAPPAAAAKK